jgi:hypothetical protein
MLGYSRDSFYRFKELYDKGGELALQEISRKKPILANRTAPEIEARIVEFSLEQPAFGQIVVPNIAAIPSITNMSFISRWKISIIPGPRRRARRRTESLSACTRPC